MTKLIYIGKHQEQHELEVDDATARELIKSGNYTEFVFKSKKSEPKGK